MIAALQESMPSDERAVLFFRQIKRELGISSTTRLVKLVSRVLSLFVRGLNREQVSRLFSRLPDIFQMLLLREWNGPGERRSFAHLDEFVDQVYEEDRKLPKSFFVSEVETLNSVIVILKRLDKYMDLFSAHVLDDAWIEELKQIPMEDAA